MPAHGPKYGPGNKIRALQRDKKSIISRKLQWTLRDRSARAGRVATFTKGGRTLTPRQRTFLRLVLGKTGAVGADGPDGRRHGQKSQRPGLHVALSARAVPTASIRVALSVGRSASRRPIGHAGRPGRSAAADFHRIPPRRPRPLQISPQ